MLTDGVGTDQCDQPLRVSCSGLILSCYYFDQPTSPKLWNKVISTRWSAIPNRGGSQVFSRFSKFMWFFYSIWKRRHDKRIGPRQLTYVVGNFVLCNCKASKSNQTVDSHCPSVDMGRLCMPKVRFSFFSNDNTNPLVVLHGCLLMLLGR